MCNNCHIVSISCQIIFINLICYIWRLAFSPYVHICTIVLWICVGVRITKCGAGSSCSDRGVDSHWLYRLVGVYILIERSYLILLLLYYESMSILVTQTNRADIGFWIIYNDFDAETLCSQLQWTQTSWCTTTSWTCCPSIEDKNVIGQLLL